MKILGKLVLDDDGEISVKMRLSPHNPNLEDIPLKELLEDFLDKKIAMEITPLTNKWEAD